MARTGLAITVGQLKGAINAVSDSITSLGAVASPNIKPINDLASSLSSLLNVCKGFKTANIDGSVIEKALPEISDDFKSKLDSLASSLKPIKSSLKDFNITDDIRSTLTKTRQNLFSFIEEFYKGDPVLMLNKDTNTLGWVTLTENLENGLTNLSTISKVLSKYNSALKGLSVAESVRKEWLSTKKYLFDFIRDFYTGNYADFVNFDTMSIERRSIAEELENGLKNMNTISTVLSKYANVIQTLSKISGINFTSLSTGFRQFLISVTNLFSDSTISNISPDVAEKFGALSRAMKGMSSFINSVVKGGDFSAFTSNITKSIPAIKEFIERMASLSRLSTFPDFERVANSLSHFNGRLKETSTITEHASKSMTKFRSILRQIYTAFVGGAVVYSIVRSIKSAVKEVFNLEYAMARVNTIARVSSNELKNMTHFVQDVSASYGIASEKVSKALYDINSATIKGVSSLKILEQSAKLAVAGFTDIDKVTNLIARAVNAYEYSVSEASKISDILFVTVERGINPMEELSEYMGRLFTVSANAGVSLEEVGAGLATLTARGYQTNVASTALNSAILKLSTGTKELNKLFQQYGYASSASALRTVGLTGALQVLYKATNGATEKLHDLGFNYRDIRAATTLASGAIDEYNKTLALMNDETYKAGLTNKAYSEAQDTVIFKFNKLKETYTVFIQTIAEYLNKNQTLKKFLEVLTSGIENVTESLRGSSLSLKDEIGSGLLTVVPKFVALYGVLNLLSKPIISIKDSFLSASKAGKGFSGVLAGMKSGASWMLPAMYVTTELSTIGSWISQINKAGTWGSGFKNVFNGGFLNTWGNLGAVALGGLGNVLDTALLGSTDFGSRLYNYYNRANYVDEKALRESRLYAGDENKSGFGKAVSAQISTLKKFDALANGLDEDKILKAYNSAIDEIQKEARSRKVSKDQLEVALKVASEQRDLLLSYNDTIKKLLPNTQALSDVFKQASKNIEESVDKFASPMEKQIREMVEAQNAITKIAKITGWSEEQIKAGGVSVSGFNQLEEMWKEQQGRSQIELANLIAPSIGSVLNPSSYTKMRTNAEKDAFSRYSEFATLMKNKTGLDIGYNYKGAISKYSDEMLDTVRHFMENPEYSNDKSISKSAHEFSLAWNELNKIKKMPDFEKYSMGIDTFISDISRLFTPEQLGLIEQHKEDLLNAFVKIPDKDKNDPDIISKKLMDIIADPELAKQLDVLGKTYLSSIHNAEQFRKSILKVGLDLSKLGTELSPEGIIGNKFNLQSVREIKERLKNTVYDPKTILGADLGVVDQYANIAMKGILGHNPVNAIVDSLVTEFKKNDALKDLDTNELQNRAISFIGAIQQIGSYTKDFVKQLSEMDYTKAMNKIRFGSELSAFKKFRLFGKDMISSLLGTDIAGAGGATFGELLREFEADTKASGFDTARDNMIKKFGDAGETVWSAFAELFKDLIGYENEFISPLNTEFRNLKKRGKDFVKNYRDSLLSPIEQFQKTEALLNRRLANIREQSKNGRLNPESIKNAQDTIEKLYKLNEETMNLKVPASITASEFVRSGSKEAFDLVARNVFKDTYKVNVRQEKLQQKLVNYSEKLWRLAEQGSKNVSESITYP